MKRHDRGAVVSARRRYIARRLFWFWPERLVRGVALLAELEALAAGEGLPAGRRSGSGGPGV